jgi:hypothetical protein
MEHVFKLAGEFLLLICLLLKGICPSKDNPCGLGKEILFSSSGWEIEK